MINGNMCVGTWKGALIVRLDRASHDRTLAEPQQWARVVQLDREVGEIERRIKLWHDQCRQSVGS